MKTQLSLLYQSVNQVGQDRALHRRPTVFVSILLDVGASPARVGVPCTPNASTESSFSPAEGDSPVAVAHD